jgi:hypothetical protein
VFISGYTADIIYRDGVFEEGKGFISKPFVTKDLLKNIREIPDRD